MKTFMTAALVAALAISAAAFGQEPGAPGKLDPNPTKGEPAKPAGKVVTLTELGQMLEAMGYEPKPVTDKDGKLTGYDVLIHSGTWSIHANVDISPNGKNIWISWTLKDKIDSSVPAEAVLAVLEQNHNIFPAYVTYFPKTKALFLAYRLLNTEVTPAALRAGLEGYAEAVKSTLTAFNKGVAIAKEKAETQAQK